MQRGVNYIDTAPWSVYHDITPPNLWSRYGQGRSERVLGAALKDIPRKAFYLATKVCQCFYHVALKFVTICLCHYLLVQVGRYELDSANMFNFTRERVIR